MLKILFYLSVFSLSLGQLSSISKSSGFNIYAFDLFVGIFFLFGLVQFLISKKILLNKGFIFLLCFIVMGIISFLLSVHKYNSVNIIFAAFYLIRFISYLGSGIIVYNMLRVGMLTRTQLENSFIYSAIFISLAGFVQLYVLPDFETLDPSLGWDPHKNRLASTFFDPNFVGAYISMNLGLVIDRVLNRKLITKFNVITGGILLTAVLFTFSRSAWLFLSTIIFIFGIFKARWMLILGIILMFLAYYSVPRIQTRLSGVTDPADSASFRLISWENSWKIAKDNFFLGVGYNFFRQVQKNYGFLDLDTYLDHSSAGSDSSLLFVLATTGIFGLVFYLLGLLLHLNPTKSTLGKALLAGLLINSLFINSLFFPQIMFMLFSLSELS